MRVISDATDAAWRSEVKAGPTAPVVRATMQRIFLAPYPYNTEDAPGGDYDHHRSRTGFYRTILFGHGGAPREIPNLRKCEWTRSTDQDVATCSLTIQNTQLVPIGSAESAAYPDDFELPGFLAYNRGAVGEASTRWGYGAKNLYSNFLMPDRLVRTFEGYGADFDVAPGDDENLYISGTWLIDDVTYNADGDIVLAMRDLGRLLLDHISFPPIVPYADYPMKWSTITTDTIKGRTGAGGSWGKPAASATSSNQAYVGLGISDLPPYVLGDGSVQGHGARGPLTHTSGDYWLSTGQVDRNGYVWWQEEFTDPQAILGVRPHTFGGPFKVYISVFADGAWQGRRKIPYSDDGSGEVSGVDVHADIPFVESVTAERGQPFDVIFRRKYANVTKVRLTFTDLRNMTAVKYPWRAGLYELSIYHAHDVSDLSFTTGDVVTPVGNYRDFTDVIRWVTSWAGWWWPATEQDNWMNFRDTHDPADRVHYDYDAPDAALVKGRIWGTLQNTGTAGIADLTADQFDKQPLMTAISKVREIVGFQFLIDETGGIVWRQPNIYSAGNYVTRGHKETRRQPERTSDFVTIDEDETLLTYETRHSSKNLRERIFVGATNGHFGAVVPGYTPLDKTGLRRVAGWLDENWKSKRECIVAGDMIAAAQMYDYRRSTFTMWGNPALQIDDQCRIFERVTNETFYHYVLSISSTLDMEQGTWNYAVESHWLGEDIETAFLVPIEQMNPATQNYLAAVGGEN